MHRRLPPDGLYRVFETPFSYCCCSVTRERPVMLAFPVQRYDTARQPTSTVSSSRSASGEENYSPPKLSSLQYLLGDLALMPELQSPLDQQESIFSRSSHSHPLPHQPGRSQPNQAAYDVQHNRTRRRIWTGTAGQGSDIQPGVADTFPVSASQSPFEDTVKLQVLQFPTRTRNPPDSVPAKQQQTFPHNKSGCGHQGQMHTDCFSMRNLEDVLPDLQRRPCTPLPKHGLDALPMPKSGILAAKNASPVPAAHCTLGAPAFVPVAPSHRIAMQPLPAGGRCGPQTHAPDSSFQHNASYRSMAPYRSPQRSSDSRGPPSHACVCTAAIVIQKHA